LFAAWDIEVERLVQAPPGVPVAALLARGDVDIGFQQRSELICVEGVDVIGAMPPGLEIVTTFSGAVCAASMQPEAARTLLAFLGSPAAAGCRRRHGFTAV
jgi:molybdate transport system substrate-binding protein